MCSYNPLGHPFESLNQTCVIQWEKPLEKHKVKNTSNIIGAVKLVKIRWLSKKKSKTESTVIV